MEHDGKKGNQTSKFGMGEAMTLQELRFNTRKSSIGMLAMRC
jgi:hypothetical protein